MPDITMPTALWEKLEDIAGGLGELRSQVKSCNEAIERTSEYQHIQNGNLAAAVAEVARVRDSNASIAAATATATAAAAQAAAAAATAAGEIARLREKLATSEGQGHGASLTWQWILAVGMFLLGVISPILLVIHIIVG